MSSINIVFCAKKGGVGKSTTAINTAGYLSNEHKCRVLLVDTDSQSSLTQFFMRPEAVDQLRREQTIAAVFDDACEIDPKKMVHETNIPGLYLVPASDHMADYNLPRPRSHGEKMFAIRRFLREVEKHFTFTILDTAPTLETLSTYAAIMAADFVVQPIVPEIFSAQSIAGVDRMLADAKEDNPDLHFLGYVVNKVQKRRAIHAANEKKLRAIHGGRVFDNVITDLTAFTEAQASRVPITQYERAGEAAKITRDFARELVGRIQKEIIGRQQRATAQEAA